MSSRSVAVAVPVSASVSVSVAVSASVSVYVNKRANVVQTWLHQQTHVYSRYMCMLM